MDLPDNELAALAGRGDAEAYRRLFERYQHPVYNFVYRLVDNAEDAADIVQDAFIKVHGVLGEREIQNFSAYLYRTARNLAYDEMRRRTRFADVDQELLAPEDPNIYVDPQRALLLQEQIGKVRVAARGLNENQRAALILRELEGLDYDQMAEVLESNRNAVGALLSRARLRFREELRMAQVKTESYPPECEEIIALLSPYIDGELAPEESLRVDGHVAQCTFCAAALEEMRSASRSFRMFIPVVPPSHIARAMTGHLEQVAAGGAQGPGKRNIIAHKALYMTIGALLLSAVAGLLLAEQSANDPSQESFGAPFTSTIRTATTPASANSGASTTARERPVTTGDVTETPSASPIPPQPAPEEPAQVSPTAFGILSGLGTPNPVNEGETISYRATISGEASSVSARLVDRRGKTAAVINLVQGATEGGNRIWGVDTTAGSYGTFTLYIDATSTDGQDDTLSAGTIQIRPSIY